MPDVDPALEGLSPSEKRETKRQAKEEVLQRETTELYTVTAAELLAAATDKPDFLVEDAIPASAITFLAGDKGERKSWLVYDLALAVARGRPWLCFPHTAKGNVLILNYDNPTGELGRRFMRMGLTAKDRVRLHSLGINSRRKIPKDLPSLLTLPTGDVAIQRIIGYLEPSLIIFDSLRRGHLLNENSSEDMAQLMSIFRSWTARGAALVILHHMPKGPRNDEDRFYTLRGAGELEGSADAVAFVAGGTIWWEKARTWVQKTKECSFRVCDDDDAETTWVETVDRFAPLREVLAAGPMLKRDVIEALQRHHVDGRFTREEIFSRALELGMVAETRDSKGTRRVSWKAGKK